MSDYISKSALVGVLEKSMKDNNHITIEGSIVHAQEHRHIIHLVEKQPTISETEIIRKAFERVLERLEERTENLKDCTKYGNKNARQQEKSYSTMYMYEVADLVEDLVDIVKEEGGIE